MEQFLNKDRVIFDDLPEETQVLLIRNKSRLQRLGLIENGRSELSWSRVAETPRPLLIYRLESKGKT